METIKGKPVTEADIQDWADQAERGYDVEQLRKRGRKPIGDGPLDDDRPARQLRLRFDPTGRLLEVVALRFVSGNELVIHAMNARRQYLDLLD